MTAERWAQVVGYEGLYEVSDQGRVRSLDRTYVRRGGTKSETRKGRVLVQNSTGSHYLKVGLLKGHCEQKTFLVHALVLQAFRGPRPEGGEHTRHLNGDYHDNRLCNLVYGTREENMNDKLLHGTNFNANKTHCKSGHEFTPENTGVQSNGRGRKCLECDRIFKRQWKERKRRRTIENDAPQDLDGAA